MPSPKPPDEDTTSPSTPKTSTPRRASAARRTPNGTPIRKTSSTPARKVSANRTPISAPARTKSGVKKPEPTLLGDFLLGRPSPHRNRRKSLDAVKAEMRAEVVGKVKEGAVKDRVKQWQKTTGAAAPAVVADEPDEIVVEMEEDSVDEDERLRIKYNQRRPGRRKSREEVGREDKQRSKSAAAPKKRVISDDHWMKNRKASPPRKGAAIPKNFLEKTAVDPPVERKIEDWVKRTDHEYADEKPRSQNISKREHMDDGIRIRPSRPPPKDEGIQVRPSKKAPIDDGIRIKLSGENPLDDGIRVAPVRKDASRRPPKDSDTEVFQTPRKRSENHLRPSTDPQGKRRVSSHRDSEDEEDDKFSWMTPSPPEKSKRKTRRSATPESLAEIPFGNSAFSVLDLPVGAEAGTMRRPPPKRNPSFSAVPKVLKKVYNVGKDIVHDTMDPPRMGTNQPPSIESWLNGTTDPFIDRPSAPSSTLEVPESSPGRRRSYKEDDQTERELTAENELERSSKRKHRMRASQEVPDREGSPLERAKTRETLPSMENSPPTSPVGLKRTPATRNTSSPKSTRKVPFKDAIFDAFKGESSTYNPLADTTGVREQVINRCPPEMKSLGPAEEPMRRSPREPENVTFREPDRPREKPLPAFPRRQAPTTGEHRLSTIVSVETFSSSSSATESATASELSQTTVTQDTAYTRPTESNLSRNSQNTGLKRRLTKHSDLISMLSLPDSGVPGRSKTIRSARSVRTNRSHIETATVQDLMRELADDETKYMRELKTLVDGVIPVLLTCVLSKSDSAVTAGLFTPDSSDSTDASLTKPIVDMGVALERLKSLHRRIPLEDSDAFLHWAQQAHKTYEDYLKAWRMGFQDVVVNLAPASRSSSSEEKSLLDGMPRNKDGDVVNSSGERVDVAYLLKRPLVRVKYMSKVIRGIDKLKRSETSKNVRAIFEELEALCRRRSKEENARMVDKAANDTDPTRARDPRTMAQVEGVTINRTRQVCAKDFFALDMQHSNGQRIECRVELLLRDKPSDPADLGDVLICAVDDISRWLLFRPIEKVYISARIGDTMGQVVVMIRGIEGRDEWRETFLLETDDYEAATEWVEMLGTEPMPPLIGRKGIDALASTVLSAPYVVDKGSSISNQNDVEIPIGERRRREAEETPSARRERRRASRHSRTTSGVPSSIKEESIISEPAARDLNDAMNKAGNLTPIKHARARYHNRSDSSPPSTPREQSSGQTTPTKAEDDKVRDSGRRDSNPDPKHFMSGGLPFIPKVLDPVTLTTPDSTQSSTPLRDSMRPEQETMKKLQKPTTPTRNDGAPPPPAHKSPTAPNTLKKTPPLESPTPRAKARRTSSPLKHEYQPSNASETSSSSEASDSEDEGTFSDSSDDDELETADLPGALPGVSIYGKRVSPSGSIYSLPNTTLAPSNSASQAPYRGVPVQKTIANTKKVTAMISSWSDRKGRWEDLYPEPCSIVITPGLIEAFELSAAHSSPGPNRDGPLESSGASDVNGDGDAGADRPLIALVLTPLVSLRQSTALDIEIQSPPTARSRLKCSGTVRYRALNPLACQDLYQAIHRARLENPVYKKLEQERMLNSYGTHSYEAAVASNRRRSWFSRKKSYRASTRAPSATISDGSGNSHSSSAFSALKRLSGGGMFNIAKSSIDTGSGLPGNVSGPTSSYGSSDSSGTTPPRTPTSPSLSGTIASNTISNNLGSENLKIRLYCLETSSKWNDIGAARLTVTQPPPGMRQASALYHGIEKRIIVTRKPSDKQQPGPPIVLLDVVLGSGCFSKVGRTGIAVNVWEDIVGDNGEVGMVGRAGGVSGRTRKWMFQCGCAADANWVFGLVAVGR